MNRLLVSAAHKSSGKTTVTLGLLAALRARGLRLAPFKKGPDYIDPLWLGLAAGQPCHNLDPHLSEAAAIAAAFGRQAQGADLALVEGNKGLHDGLDLDGRNSNAALARALGLPVLLVIDCRGMTRGIAPLLLGYQAFERAVCIAGVVLNRVGGPRHESKLRAAVDHYTDIPVLGAVAEDERLQLQERHLGLTPCGELGDAAARVAAIGRIVGEQVDLQQVQALAAAAGPFGGTVQGDQRVWPGGSQPRVRIGVARDRAFAFYYPDDLDTLQRHGAELVFIDTLADRRLPALDGLFIGGGFPETCLDGLQANGELRAALRLAIAAGMPTYAECGGLMYLCRSIAWGGRRAEMVGAIEADAVMQPRPVGRGYVQCEETAAMPWAAAEPEPAAGSRQVKGHEFHHSRLENLAPATRFAYRMRRGHGVDGAHDGIVVHRLLASYTHLRDGAGSAWARRFLAYVRSSRAALPAAPACEPPPGARAPCPA